MKEQLEEAYNNIKDRFKNSFIITFLVVWVICHWELVYSVFNFDSEENLESKIFSINHYLKCHNMIWIPMGIAIISLILLYIIFIFSEIIHSYYSIIRNKTLKAIGDSKKIIEIEKYNELGQELDKIRSRAGELQRIESEYILSKQGLEQEVSALSNQLEQANSQLTTNSEAIANLGKIQEENGKNILRITELELEKIELLESVNRKSSEVLILESLRTRYKKEKETNDLLNSFLLWVNLNHDKVTIEWNDLSNENRQETLQFYKDLIILKKIFGDYFWHHSKIRHYNDNQSTLKFTPFPVPYFASRAGMPLYNIQSIEKMGEDVYRLYLHKTFDGNEKITLTINKYAADEIDGTYTYFTSVGDSSLPITLYKQENIN